jgi:hypothetical protein
MKINSKQMLIDKIEARRIKRGLSVRKMCIAAEANHVLWSRYKSGDRTPNWDYIIPIAESLGIKIEIHAKFR